LPLRGAEQDARPFLLRPFDEAGAKCPREEGIRQMAKEAVLYEAMYILDTSLTDEQIAACEQRLCAGLEGEGASVESIQEFGRRRLGYAIKGHTEGIYRVLYFKGSGAAVDELRHEMSLSEEIVRGVIHVANPKFLIGPKPEVVAEPEAEEAAEEVAEEAAEEAPAEAEVPAEAAEEAPADEAAPAAEQ
jgi:small subunit ribosomal protein S6